MKKKAIIFLFMLAICYIYAQEEGMLDISENDVVVQQEEEKKEGEASTKEKDVHTKGTAKTLVVPSPFGFYFGAKFSLNKVDEEERVQPFEASAMLGFEYEWRVKKHFSLEPSIDATFLHYMLYSSIATHSENENRTAFTVALSCELPFMAVFEVERVSLSFGAGIATIIRGSALDLGIKGDDVGASGLTASDEVKKINLYHWQSGRWFYPTLRFKTGYTFESGWKASLLFGAYIPIFNAWNKNHLDTKNGKVPFLHDAIFNIGFSIHPAKKK